MVEFWKIGEFAKELDKHASTVDNWFRKLEEKQLHYVNRADEERIYDEFDMEIARVIKEKREENKSLEEIFQELNENYELRPFPSGGGAVDMEALRAELMEELASSAEQDRVKDAVLRREVERALREESLREWEGLPKETRMKRGRLFLKVEDNEKRDKFVELYTDRRFEEKLKEVLAEKE
ncbi:MerR family transcriptional regulator [Alteribacter keqinensis]|uniref:MerR family transcriptional regulator n=1 Tax=Alteribacter keqinensis TaxID=2483800 RepID=A0A3M7TQ47_9BACI|nr:MerR family transcriptional regulator [Alteribacter keqinensis]RNA67766.1 MerR family transcriptional regulator [Alteribacter keqinensis]